jgi:hypothetical protein
MTVTAWTIATCLMKAEIYGRYVDMIADAREVRRSTGGVRERRRQWGCRGMIMVSACGAKGETKPWLGLIKPLRVVGSVEQALGTRFYS